MSLKNILRENLEKYSKDNTIIGSNGYDIVNDSKAEALLDVLLDKGEEVGLTSIKPDVTKSKGINIYYITFNSPDNEPEYEKRYYVATEDEINRFLINFDGINRRGFENLFLGESGDYRIYSI